MSVLLVQGRKVPHVSRTHDRFEERWRDAIERHRTATSGFLRTALRVEERSWRIPVKAGKWTPAQITDHLIRTYRIVVEQVRDGGPGIRPRTGFLLRRILRVAFLPRILRTRRFPSGAKAPSEIRPVDSNVPRERALGELEELSVEFEREISLRRKDKNLILTHSVFGEIDPLRGIDFIAIHTEHHGRQIYPD